MATDEWSRFLAASEMAVEAAKAEQEAYEQENDYDLEAISDMHDACGALEEAIDALPVAKKTEAVVVLAANVVAAAVAEKEVYEEEGDFEADAVALWHDAIAELETALTVVKEPGKTL